MARFFRCRYVATAVAIATLSMLTTDRAASAIEEPPVQKMISLPVQVVDAEGRPVAGAKIIPWALGCSQGHGFWKPDGFGRSEPPVVSTDSEGSVEVTYPGYAVLAERVRTTLVTLSIDHPDFTYIGNEHLNVPRDETEPHVIKLARGAVVEIVPMQEGHPAQLEGLHVTSSDGRSQTPNGSRSVPTDGVLRLPPMPAGKGQVFLVRVDGEQATHFSEIVELDLTEGETLSKKVELRPAVRIQGRLSDNVPRPVTNGRIKARTLPREWVADNVNWHTWSPIASDGTFQIEAWPVSEPVQLVALCDRYIAESGARPDVVAEVRDPDPFFRPQVFATSRFGGRVTVNMTPLVRCEIQAVDEAQAPLEGVKIEAYPNVGWWNEGSQIYCHPLVKGETYLITRDYFGSTDRTFPFPFQESTDAQGKCVLYLPVGSRESIAIYPESDSYELQIVRGQRRQQVPLVAGETAMVRLTMQAKGSDYLGEWDKLAGILFGCTGEECRRLLEDEGFRNKMTEVRLRLDKADDPTDPSMLSGAFTEIAEAFDELGDQEEVRVWRRKAAEQKAKLQSESNGGPPPQ